MRRLFAVWTLAALVATACGGSTADTTTTSAPTTTTSTTTTAPTTTSSSSSSTTTAPATTTTYAEGTTVTTYPSAFASPLNGLPSENELSLDRRAIGVKVDNHVNARPQSGVLEADMVVETRVEAGLTRFIAFYHDNDHDYVGPIRSVRPTDSTIAAAIGAPLVISGGQQYVQELTAGRGVGLIGPGAGKLFRTSRPAPHNLYGSTTDMRAGADAQGYPDDPPHPLYTIGEWAYPDATAEFISLDWSDGVTVEWDYSDGVYHRVQDGVAHEAITRDGQRTQITAEVLVILAGEFYTVFSPSGNESAVPAIDTVGSGQAWVFARGRVWQGTWQRADIDDPFVLVSGDGSTATVPPGFPWVSIFPEHRSVTWS